MEPIPNVCMPVFMALEGWQIKRRMAPVPCAHDVCDA